MRDCEARWATDCYKVATGELDPNAVSLVGISGRPRNAMLLFADMCHMGYGVAKDEEQARQWWNQSAEDGNRVAAQRLRSRLRPPNLNLSRHAVQAPQSGRRQPAQSLQARRGARRALGGRREPLEAPHGLEHGHPLHLVRGRVRGRAGVRARVRDADVVLRSK